MIDEATVEQWMRDANPIPTLDDVDADEFARFVAAAHTRRAAVMQAPTQHPTTTSPITPPPHRRRRAWAFAAGFVVIVLVVGAAAQFLRGEESPVADEPMVPVAVTTPPSTTSAPNPIDVEALTWSRVPHDEAVFDPTMGEDVMVDVAAGGPGFVAVGWVSAVGGPAGGDDSLDPSKDAGVWISKDGITWSLVTSVEPNTIAGPYPMEVDPLRTGLAYQSMESVTVGGPGLVAVGTDWNVPEGSDAFSLGAVWTSEDGISWSKVIVEPESAVVQDVTAGGPGLVAVGSVLVGDRLGGEAEWVGSAWTSVDGITWNHAPQDLPGSEWMASVTAGGPGLVAVGAGESAMWTSPDGLTWARVPHDAAVFSGSVEDVTAGGPGFVAVGGSTIGGAAVWTSPDGFTWTLVPPTGFPDSEAPLRSVVSVGSQLVAISGEEWNSEVWTSVDGVTWSRSLIPGDGTVHSVAMSDSGLIAVGADGGAAAVWVATEG